MKPLRCVLLKRNAVPLILACVMHGRIALYLRNYNSWKSVLRRVPCLFSIELNLCIQKPWLFLLRGAMFSVFPF